MKKSIILIILTLGLSDLYGQEVTYKDFKSLIPFLQKEDWQKTYDKSEKLLANTEKDTSEFKAIVTYIHIYSAAGLVSEKKMTYQDLRKNILKYQGQKIIMASHRINDTPGGLNLTTLTVTDSTSEAFTVAANLKGINILCFEKFILKDRPNKAEFDDTIARCGGILDKIETNPNESMLWIIRLTVKDAFIRKAQ